jgi:hypothetical protein
VAAAGNSAADPCTWYYDPVTTSDKLIVGSTTDGDDASYFSNYGACVHVQVLTPPTPRLNPTCACPPASGRPPAPARPPARHRTEPPPRMCAGPWLQNPGCLGRLKQHRHQHH